MKLNVDDASSTIDLVFEALVSETFLWYFYHAIYPFTRMLATQRPSFWNFIRVIFFLIRVDNFKIFTWMRFANENQWSHVHSFFFFVKTHWVFYLFLFLCGILATNHDALRMTSEFAWHHLVYGISCRCDTTYLLPTPLSFLSLSLFSLSFSVSHCLVLSLAYFLHFNYSDPPAVRH